MRRLAAAAAVGLTLAACSATTEVAVEQSRRSTGAIVPDGQAGRPGDTEEDGERVERPEGTIAWGDCGGFGIPAWVTEATSGWECGRLETVMDPFGDSADLPVVDLALTRHRATGDRIGAIVLNPGGPGAAGLPTAWAVRPSMPTELLRGFDIVAWDPRGVGRSTPRADCGGVGSFDPDFIETCVATTGPLSRHLSAPHSVADLEAVRVALGEKRLHYLGFSYGSILGAGYAARYEMTTGSFVLDGVTDPDAGSPDGPFEDGFATFAVDGRDAAYDRFAELCDATERCLPTAGADDTIEGLADDVAGLPTDRYAGDPERVDAEALDDTIDLALTYAGDWELVATALGDAAGGDASALASLVDAGDESSDDSPGDGEDEGADDPFGDNFADANFMIYCADFGPVITEWSFCDDMPVNEPRLEPIAAVDVDRPILVIGTEYDPLTPGLHAPEFADRLGDATHMIWEGVGHTAFPGWTDCIDDAVADQYLGRRVPADGTRCATLADIAPDDDEALGDRLFGFDRNEALDWVADAFSAEGRTGDDAACLAESVVADRDADVDDDLVSHLVLDVASDAAVTARATADAEC